MTKILVVACEIDIKEKILELGCSFGISFSKFIFLIENFTENSCVTEGEQVYVIRNFAVHSDVEDVVDRICISHKISDVISNDEFSVYVAAYVRQRLQLVGMSCSDARKFRDKQLMKKVATLHGIPIPREYSREDIAQGEINFPIVLKPRSLAGAVGVKLINSPAELPALQDNLDESYKDMDESQYILESYNPRNIVHIDCVVISGRIVFMSVGAYEGSPLNYLHGYMLGCVSIPKDDVFSIWWPFVEKLKAAFKLPNGVFHIEAFEGGDKDAELMEIAYRPGGGPITDAILLTYGVDLRLVHLSAQLGLIDEVVISEKNSTYAYLIYPKEHHSPYKKEVISVTCPDLTALPTLKKHMLARKGELASGEFYSHKDCLGMFVFSGDTYNVIMDYEIVKKGYKLTLGDKG